MTTQQYDHCQRTRQGEQSGRQNSMDRLQRIDHCVKARDDVRACDPGCNVMRFFLLLKTNKLRTVQLLSNVAQTGDYHQWKSCCLSLAFTTNCSRNLIRRCDIHVTMVTDFGLPTQDLTS